MADIESLELQITSDSKDAKAGLDALITTLDTLKTKTKGGLGLSAIANSVGKLATEAGKLNGSEGAKLESLAKGLQALSGLGSLKLSFSVANQITAMGDAVKKLDGVDYSKLSGLATAVQPLTNLGKSNLGSVLGQIKKLPEVMTELGKVDMGSFTAKIKELTASLKPLADEMQKVANGFSAFPAKIQTFLSSNSTIPSSNERSSKSFTNLAAKITATFYVFKRAARVIASWINESSEYTENQNLFTVAMGQYASSAQEYAETVGEALGIDPSDWMRSQGVFMTLATGFGVAGDRAATMSQQLTQLGYDLSSFFNISTEEAMQKLKSGFAGELEPLRNLGYDLSQAKLEAIALSLGIDKSVSSMTQAEKAQLRYYAIMTQVTTAQGDMARTLDAPANQLRVLSAQATQAARALGDLFIPALNAILPVAIAVLKVITSLAKIIARLFGSDVSKGNVSDGMSNLANNAGSASSEIDNATSSAKKLRRELLGVDELNVMSADSGTSGSGVIGGSGFDFELPTYDFISDLTETRVAQIVKDMMDWLGITEDITSWSELMDTRFGNILKTVGAIGIALAVWKIGGGIVAAAGSISTAIGNITTALATAKGAIVAATGASLGTIALVVAAIAAVVAGLTAVYLTNEDVRTSVDNAVASIGSSLVPLFDFMTGTVLPNLKSAWEELLVILRPLGEWVETIFTSAWMDMLVPALEWVGSTAVPNVIDVFKELWNDVLVPLGSFIGSVLTPVFRILSEFMTMWWKNVTIPIANFIGGVFSTAWENLVKILREVVIPRLNNVISLFQFLWNNVLSPFVNFLWGILAPAFEEALRGIGNGIQSLKTTLSGLINFITGVFTLDWKQAWSGVTQLFTGIFSGIGNGLKTPLNVALALIESFINKIIDGWNSLKKKLNSLSITIPQWLGGGTFGGFNLQMSSAVSLPRLAGGGVVADGQMFVANEAGPELVGNVGRKTAVMNNDQIVESVSKGVYQAVVAAMGSSRGDQVVEAKVNDKVLFEVMVSRARQETVRTGYNPLLGGV